MSLIFKINILGTSLTSSLQDVALLTPIVHHQSDHKSTCKKLQKSKKQHAHFGITYSFLAYLTMIALNITQFLLIEAQFFILPIWLKKSCTKCLCAYLKIPYGSTMYIVLNNPIISQK